MKGLSKAHIDRLDALHRQSYLDACVKELTEIGFANPFPSKKGDYMRFVEHVYDVACKYGLKNEKHAFALMLAWHVKGDDLIKTPYVVELLDNANLASHTKAQHLMKIAVDTMKRYENSGEEKEYADT